MLAKPERLIECLLSGEADSNAQGSARAVSAPFIPPLCWLHDWVPLSQGSAVAAHLLPPVPLRRARSAIVMLFGHISAESTAARVMA